MYLLIDVFVICWLEDEEGVHRRKKRKPMKTSSPLDVLSSTPYVDSMTDELRDCYYAPAAFLVRAPAFQLLSVSCHTTVTQL
jgi:hypothetical protein